MASATRKFRFDSFATEFANSSEEGKAETTMKEERPKSDICDNDSGIGEWWCREQRVIRLLR